MQTGRCKDCCRGGYGCTALRNPRIVFKVAIFSTITLCREYWKLQSNKKIQGLYGNSKIMLIGPNLRKSRVWVRAHEADGFLPTLYCCFSASCGYDKIVMLVEHIWLASIWFIPVMVDLGRWLSRLKRIRLAWLKAKKRIQWRMTLNLHLSPLVPL